MATDKSASSKATEARRAAAELRAKQNAATRRNTILASIGALALIAVFAVIVVFIIQTGEKKESGEYAVYSSGVLKAPSIVVDDAIIVGPGGIAGVTPSADAVRLDLVEDPICPWCAIFSEVAGPEIEVLLDQGEVVLYFRIVSIFDYQSAGTFYSTRMGGAWLTVAEYDPEHFWAFVKTSYANAPAEGVKGLTNDEIAGLARAAGVSEEVIDKIADGEFTLWLEAASERAAETYRNPEDGRFSTPTFLIDGVRFGYWTTPGNTLAGVAYVQEYGAEAFEVYLATPPEPSPSPAASS